MTEVAALAGRPDALADEVAAIRALVEQAAPPDLAPRLAVARQRWPNDLRLLLLHGAWLEKSGDPAAAEACYRQGGAEHPGNPWPHVRLMELALGRHRAAEAATIFAQHVWPGGAPEGTRTGLLSRVAVALPDVAARREFLDGLLRDVPDDRFVLLKLAALSVRERSRAEAEQFFAAAQKLGPLPLESQLLALELHLAAARFEEAFALATELHVRHPERADLARRAIQAAHFSGRLGTMIALLRDALQRWPRDWLLAFRYNRCTIPMRQDRPLFALLSRHADAVASDERWQFQFVIACLRHGETARAMAILDGLSETGPVAHMAMPLRAALRAHPAATWRNARAISNDPERDVQIVRVPDAIATVVVLAGVQGGLGYLPFSHADGLLAQRPVNVVYLRDLNNRGFTSGVRGFGPEQDDMVAQLAAIGAELGVPVITTGASLGGIAAIRTAALMHAHAAISFAGPIQHGAGMADEEPGRPAGGTRSSLLAVFTEAGLSVVDLIRAAPRTRFHQCFGTEYAPDREAAELLRHVPNAMLHGVAGCADHFVIEHMIAGHGFHDMLDRAIRTPAP